MWDLKGRNSAADAFRHGPGTRGIGVRKQDHELLSPVTGSGVDGPQQG